MPAKNPPYPASSICWHFFTAMRSQAAPHVGSSTANRTQVAFHVHVCHRPPKPTGSSSRSTHNQPYPTSYSGPRFSPLSELKCLFMSENAPATLANWLHMSDDALPTFEK